MNDSDSESESSEYPSFGSYTVFETDRLLDAFVKAGIRFEIECDDGASFTAAREGSYGQRSRVYVFLDGAQQDEARKIEQDILGASTP